ncbi:MAG: GMC family oxidoreductase, partial [Actinomycetota bacterium]
QLSEQVLREEELVGAGGRMILSPSTDDAIRQDDGVTAEDIRALTEAVGGRPPGSVAGIVVAGEQRLDRESRVTLGSEVDPLGVPRVVVDWKQADLERRSMIRFLEILAQELGHAGAGRVQIVADGLEPTYASSQSQSVADYRFVPSAEPDEFDVLPGNHHMCTTRMAADPSSGVVDADGLVFGTTNLYAAGSSVFATGGLSPPTFTIVALSLRLADHLTSVLGR